MYTKKLESPALKIAYYGIEPRGVLIKSTKNLGPNHSLEITLARTIIDRELDPEQKHSLTTIELLERENNEMHEDFYVLDNQQKCLCHKFREYRGEEWGPEGIDRDTSVLEEHEETIRSIIDICFVPSNIKKATDSLGSTEVK